MSIPIAGFTCKVVTDPKERSAGKGTVISFRVMTSRFGLAGSRDEKQKTDFWNASCWRKQEGKDWFADKIVKGASLEVLQGYIQAREYESKDKGKQTFYEICISKFRPIDIVDRGNSTSSDSALSNESRQSSKSARVERVTSSIEEEEVPF